ncbi:type IV pilus secretin PilQ [Aquirhabdus parva]
MRSVARRFVIKALPMHLAIVSACAITMTAYASSTVTLTGINTTALPNNETELRLAFDGTPPNPQAYQLDKPARLVVDLPNAKSSLASRYQDIGSGNARSLAVVDNAERTRLVVNLSQASGYSTRVEGNTLVLKVGGTKVSAAKAVATPTSVNTAMPVAGNKNIAYEVTDVDFRRGGAGEGNVLIALNNPNAPVDVQQQGTKIIARFLGTKLPERLRRRLDVNDFGTPIKTIDAYNEGNNGILVIQPQGDFEYLAYQADNKLTISVKPVVQQKTAEAKLPTYTGQKLSLNFQDIEVRSVLQLIADFTGLNLVASDTVAGKITIRLQNVPWDQALDIVLKTKGLDKRRNGNVIMIAPADELAAREKIEIQNNRQVEQLAPLTTQYIQLSYAKASDLLLLITSGRNNGGGGNGSNGIGSGGDANVGSLLSPRGTVSIDARTNTLIVQDTAVTIDKVREMIARLDVPIKQVMIEARIVRASDTFSKELGVQWGILSHGTASRPNLLVGGNETTLFDLRNPQSSTLNGQTGVSYTITRPDNLSVDLAATGSGASSIALGVMSISDIMLDLTLSALQADGKGEVIATPKVLTLDKQKARVAAGTQIPYQQSTSSGATSVAFVNAELSLEVTPSITPDGRVGMDLLVNADSPGDAAPNGQLTINTNRLQTNVLVDDGQTVVLGGIFQNQISSSTTKVPFLGDLPYLGRLFRHTLQSNNKQEMLIFVTPRLVNSTTQVNQSAKP